MIRQFKEKAAKILEKFRYDLTPEEMVDQLNIIVNHLNNTLGGISLTENFKARIMEVKIPATSNLKIQHLLGVTPKYRLILRQEGNGVLTDIPSGWNNKEIEIRNNGSVEVKATIMLLRE